jgi:serine/threonine-protein kinase
MPPPAQDPAVTLDANPDGAPPHLSDPGELLPFPAWERYQLVAFLGAGGMGSVYKALDPRLGRGVAIKFLRSSQLEARDSRQRRRFEREARAQASIDHPNICKIYEVGEISGQPFIAMQLIDGQPASALFGQLPREGIVRIAQKMAEALHAAHGQGLIHRDRRHKHKIRLRSGHTPRHRRAAVPAILLSSHRRW